MERRALSLVRGSKGEPVPTVGPAEAAHRENRQKIDSINAELAEKGRLRTEVSAALASAKEAAVAPDRLRAQIEEHKAGLVALQELGVRCPTDASQLIRLVQELRAAEKASGTAKQRVLIEGKKESRLEADCDALKLAQSQAVSQNIPLGFEALWERLAASRTRYEAARNAFMVAFDETFAIATAIDRLAADHHLGRFAGAAGAPQLHLPLVEGMVPLGYSALEHARSREQAATDVLKQLGLV